MRACLLILLILPTPARATVVLDRIAAVVGRHAIKTSDIDREVRLTDFLNGQPLDLSAGAKRKAVDRLVDQEIIRNELQVGGYSTPPIADVNRLLDQIKTKRFRTAAQYEDALRRYGLAEGQLRAQLLWQLTVLHFIEQRFRPGVLVSDKEIRDYYETHAAELRKTSGTQTSLEALRPKIEDILAGEKVNQQFFAWLDQNRKLIRAQIREDAFQ